MAVPTAVIMVAKHKSTIHGRCPLNGNWDYYKVTIRASELIDVAELERAFDSVRGTTQTQEEIAVELRKLLPAWCAIKIRGRHSQNTKSTVSVI